MRDKFKSTPSGWTKERRFQRSGCDLPAYYSVQGSWKPARIITISAGGAFLACKPEKIQKDKIIEVQFQINDKTISALGRVVWINPRKMKNRTGFPYPPGFAVEFERISAEERAEIDQFVKKNLRILRTIAYELTQPNPDREKIKELFLKLRPEDSLHLNHIKKVVKYELRHFRIRKQ